jgi:ribosomal protein S18 acetylase RimI-like enzyme
MFVRYPTYTYELHDDVTDANLARAIVVEYGEGDYFIESIAVPPKFQGLGHGREMMGLLVKEHGSVTLTLKVNAYGSKRLDDQALEAWYGRLGFVWDDDHEYMVRYPDGFLAAPKPIKT